MKIVRRVDPTDTVDVSISGNIITNANQSGEYGNGIYLVDISNANIENNKIRGAYAGIRENTLLETNAADYNNITNNIIESCTAPSIWKMGSNTIIDHNPGYITENTGTATIPASSTSITVNHGLVAAPTKITVTPFGNVGNCWVDSSTITSTQFTIWCSTAPTENTTVTWYAEI